MNNTSLMCINSWRRNLKGYQIIKWDEDSINLSDLVKKNKFLKKCYELKLWAFVSDYLRLYILYNYGGIYMDTDVEVIKTFDDYLDNRCFMGYEGYEQLNQIGTGTIGAAKGNKTIKALLDFYEEEIWNVDYFINPIIFRELKRQKPDLFEGCLILPQHILSPFDPQNEKYFAEQIGNDETVCIHWYNANWGMSRKGYVFLNTKHIKNKYLHALMYLKKNFGYYRKKFKVQK